MPHATVPSSGLQALILCGPGSSLSTFTSNPKDFPKAVIPIANRPMVWYPLDWCYRMGVTDITLVIAPESLQALEAALATNPSLTGLPSPKPEILTPTDLTQTTGTGELLRLPEVQKCIVSDFILLPCDLISEIDGTKILQQWLTLNPLSNVCQPGKESTGGKAKGGLAVFYPTYGHEGISTKKDETDFIATVPLSSRAVPAAPGSLRPNIEQVVMAMPTDSLNDRITADKGAFRLRSSLLAIHSRVKFRTKYRDAHVYVLPKWVKDFAQEYEGVESVSEDLMGWWAKATWQDTALAEKLGLGKVLRGEEAGEAKADGEDVDELEDEIDVMAMSSTKTSSLSMGTETKPTFASRVGVPAATTPKPLTGFVVPPLLAYVQPSSLSVPSPLIRRVDTTSQLLSTSLYLAKLTGPSSNALIHENKIHPSAQLEQQSRVASEDCLIAENVKLAFRSNVKESVIGANCEIGRNVRLTRCLLMEGVTIGDGVVMTGCIVGRRARVEGVKRKYQEHGAEKTGKGKAVETEEEDKTKLVDCEIAPGFVVEAGTEAKGEKFMGFDTDGVDVGEDEMEMEDEGEGMEGIE